jgi:hypothetical protein
MFNLKDMKIEFITPEQITGITPNLNRAKVLNNRITLLDLLSKHTGMSNSEILKDPNKVDLKQIFEKASKLSKDDQQDLVDFKCFRNLQEAVEVNLYL